MTSDITTYVEFASKGCFVRMYDDWQCHQIDFALDRQGGPCESGGCWNSESALHFECHQWPIAWQQPPDCPLEFHTNLHPKDAPESPQKLPCGKPSGSLSNHTLNMENAELPQTQLYIETIGECDFSMNTKENSQIDKRM